METKDPIEKSTEFAEAISDAEESKPKLAEAEKPSDFETAAPDAGEAPEKLVTAPDEGKEPEKLVKATDEGEAPECAENLQKSEDEAQVLSKKTKKLLKTGKAPGFKISGLQAVKLSVLLLVLILAAGGLIFLQDRLGLLDNDKDRITTVASTMLQEISEVSELSTMEYVYNSVAKIRDDQGNIRYYAAYEGVVKAGIDFSKIKAETDIEAGVIRIILPAVEIQEYNVLIDSLEFIFNKNKYDTAEIAPQAYQFCLEDLKLTAGADTELLAMAAENAESTVKALVLPWISNLEEDYTIEIVTAEEAGK